MFQDLKISDNKNKTVETLKKKTIKVMVFLNILQEFHIHVFTKYIMT